MLSIKYVVCLHCDALYVGQTCITKNQNWEA